MRQSVCASLLLVLATGAGSGEGSSAPRDPLGAASFRLRVDTPAVEVLTRTDGFVELRLEGFRTSEGSPGAPDIPVRTVLVAIPPGAEPWLEIVDAGAPSRRAVVPRPVPKLSAEASSLPAERPAEDRDLWTRAERPVVRAYDPDPAIYDTAAVYPARAAWLGEIGILRRQRYVEVHLAPVRYDGGDRGLVIDETIEAIVHFDGLSAATADSHPDRFEAVYRRAFVNYEQGRRFRLDRPTAGAATAIVADDPSPLRRIVVRRDGIVRLDHDLFIAEAPEFLTHDPATWVLTGRGVQVPLHIRQGGGDPSLLEAGEWVQFYGQALDDEPKTVLNFDNGGNEDLYAARDFSDDNVYFLSVVGGTQPEMTTREAAPGPRMPPSFFDATSHVEVDDVFLPLGGADPWYWDPVLIELDPLRTETLRLRGLLSGTSPARVRVHVRGDSSCAGVDPDHVTRVSLQNDIGQTLVLPAGDPNNVGNENVGQFDGRTLFLHDFEWTHSGVQPQLTDPLQVSVSVDDVVGCSNDVYLDWIEVDYRRSFAAIDDALIFDYPDGAEVFAVTGLLTSDVQIYEITDEIGTSGTVDAVRLTSVQVQLDESTYTAKFRMEDHGSGEPRRFVVAGTGGVSIPAAADFQADRVSTLKQDTTPAELIVVAHPDLLDSLCSEGGNPCSYDVECTSSPTDRCELDPTSELSLLLAHRDTQGITSRVARIQDVEDEFNDGLAGPLAIESLVAWTFAGGWSGEPPAYMLLLGDASYDYKAGETNGNYVSTQLMFKDNEILGFFASDNLLAAVSGDDSLPELTVGRISVRSLAEAETVAQKVRLYEQSPPPGAWRGNAVFISDRAADFGLFESLEFERINEVGEDLLLDAASYTSQHLRYWSDYCEPSGMTCWVAGNSCLDNNDCAGGLDVCTPCDRVAMRQAIQDSINAVSGPGAVLGQFVGHGNFELWSNDVLHCVNPSNPVCPDGDDIQTLGNGAKLPWLLVENCLTGGFHSVQPRSVGEDWLKHAAGGAIAVFAPSGLGFRYLGEIVVNEVWRDLFGPTKERELYVPVMSSLVQLCATTGTPEGCQYYTLLGDPSMTLALPQVSPPTDVGAVGGNGVVDLSWTASATPNATYDVYRTTNLALDYTKVGSSIAGNTFPDETVVNGQVYYYYLVARDVDGFESRWSNFNSDCAVSGEDCVRSRPVNPFPPSQPQGLEAVDAETGGRLELNWLVNPEDDIDQYTVHYGTTTALGNSLDVSENSASLTGLLDDTLYFVAVTATNTSGLTSDPSTQASAIPTLVLGVKSPGFIDDLELGKSGNDALLTWGAVTTDIYGKPLSVDHYEVFRGTAPEFVPMPSNMIGVSTAPSFVDVNSLREGQPDHHYLVRAVDGAGNAGGLGNQLPGGIRDLRVSRLAGGDLLVWWSPVTKDFGGEPLVISHYELYAADGPFGRADIGGPSVTLLDGSITTTSTIISPQPQSRYYSVLAVDPRGNRSPF